jgi:ABC-type sugar transport system ATPase subunit
MRDGRRVGTTPTAQLSREQLITQMIGRESSVMVPAARDHSDVSAEPAATVRGLSGGAARDVGFEILPGEILGLAGLSGSGRTSILETLYGLHGEGAHELRLNGEAVSFSDPKEAIAAGVAFVSEDRTVSGYVPSFSVAQTATLPFLGSYGRHAWLRPGIEASAGRQLIERLDVRPPDARATMSSLSGGNQQKVILGRWLSHPLKLLLLDEPTHGVDVGAKENIYRLLQEIAAEGIPIVFASSEFEELEALCRRVLLLHEGRIAGELVDEGVGADLVLASLLRMHTGNGDGGGGGNADE